MPEDLTVAFREDSRLTRPRIAYAKVAPEAMEATQGLENYVRRSGLELVKVRAPPRSTGAFTA